MTLIQGDVVKSLQSLPNESVDCIMTSPPYWALRDYGVEHQVGLEPTPEEYVERMLQVTVALNKVLKKTGTFWLNVGDTYGGSNSRTSNGGLPETAIGCRGSRKRAEIERENGPRQSVEHVESNHGGNGDQRAWARA